MARSLAECICFFRPAVHGESKTLILQICKYIYLIFVLLKSMIKEVSTYVKNYRFNIIKMKLLLCIFNQIAAEWLIKLGCK